MNPCATTQEESVIKTPVVLLALCSATRATTISPSSAIPTLGALQKCSSQQRTKNALPRSPFSGVWSARYIYTVRGKLRIEPWGSVNYGQNLDVKELRSRNRRSVLPRIGDAAFAALGRDLDNDRPIEILGQGWTSHRGLWKMRSSPQERGFCSPPSVPSYILGHPEYRERQSANLRRELSRIPCASATNHIEGCHSESGAKRGAVPPSASKRQVPPAGRNDNTFHCNE